MAISFDAFAGGVLVSSATTQTTSITIGATADILFAGTINRGNTASGVKCGGVSMTQIGTGVVSVANGNNDKLQLWYLLNPPTGTQNCVVTVGASTIINSAFASYIGANTSGQPDASAVASETDSTSQTLTVTTVADNCWGIAVGRDNDTGSLSAGSGTTKRGGTSGGLDIQLFDSGGAWTPAGSHSLVMTSTLSHMMGLIASFSPTASTVTTQEQTLTLMGFGS